MTEPENDTDDGVPSDTDRVLGLPSERAPDTVSSDDPLDENAGNDDDSQHKEDQSDEGEPRAQDDDEESDAEEEMQVTEDEKVDEEGEVDEENVDLHDDSDAEGTIEEQNAFIEELLTFFKDRSLEYKPPKFYGEELNVLKLWRAVTALGGYDQVTSGKLWRQVGEKFNPPQRCTTISWSFRGFYKKALLDYEKFKSGVVEPTSTTELDASPTRNENQAALSPPNTSPPPTVSTVGSSGRARRDSAARAMQGWHSQRLGNGEIGEPIIKDRSGSSKKEKHLKNLGGSKRKDTAALVERAVKVARAKGAKGARSRSLDDVPVGNSTSALREKATSASKKSVKQERTKHLSKVHNMEPSKGLNLVITDDGPPADWVKINVHKTPDGFEIYALVPGLAREEVRIQCEEGGRVVICGSPEQPNNPWGVTAFRKVINLPAKIDAHHTSAVVTLYGQLFVRVPFSNAYH